MATIYDGYDPSATTWDNAYRLRLLVENTPNAATNSSTVRIRMILYANGTQWFSGWTITENVDYATWSASNVKSAVVAVQNSPSGNQTQGSAGADKTWVDKSYTVPHDINGNLRMSLHGDFKTNTAPSTTYPYLVPPMTIGPAVSTATGPNSTTQNIGPYFTTGFSAAPTVTRTNNGGTLAITPSNAVVTNTSANNTVTYNYQYSLDGTNWTGDTSSAAGWTGISVSATTAYNVYVRCVTNSNGITTSAGPTYKAAAPSAATGLSAAESETQSRDVTIYWTPGAANGSAITAQTLVWGTDPNLTTGTVQQFFDGTTSSYTILNNRLTGALSPNTTYYYKITMSNAVGDNGTGIYSLAVRPSAPLVSVFDNTFPDTRTIVKVWTGSAMEQANLMVYNGSTWVYLK